MTDTILTDEGEAVITAMEKNMREKLKYIASRLDSMTFKDVHGVSVVDSRLPSDTFNTAFGGNIDEKLAQEVFDYYKKTNQPMAWWIGSTSASGKESAYLEKAGFAHDELDIGMVCDLTQVADDYKSPENLTIRRCTTAEDYADFGDVLASVFDPPDEQAKLFYKKIATLNPDSIKDMVLFVGYEENKPVATACLFLTDVAGIYDIVTRPEKRNKGYGSAMFYRALEESKNREFKKGVLQASPDGLNIYKRFGFKEMCQFNVWSNQIKSGVL